MWVCLMALSLNDPLLPGTSPQPLQWLFWPHPTPDLLRALTRGEAALLLAVEVLIGGHDYGDNGNLEKG